MYTQIKGCSFDLVWKGGEQERQARGRLQKRHFKFIYNSPFRMDITLYILLDVLFEENHYKRLVQKEIANDLLITRGKIQPDDFPSYVRGSRNVLQHIYATGFSMEQAVKFAPKLLYMAACLLTETPFTRLSDGTIYRNEELYDEDLKTLKFIRKADSIGYGYLLQTDRLLQQFR